MSVDQLFENTTDMFKSQFPPAVAYCLDTIRNFKNSTFIQCPPLFPGEQSTAFSLSFPSLVKIEGKGEFFFPSFGVDFNILPAFTVKDDCDFYFTCVRGLHKQKERYFIYLQVKTKISMETVLKWLEKIGKFMEEYSFKQDSGYYNICVLLIPIANE